MIKNNKNKKSKLKKTAILIAIIAIIYYLFNMYKNIDIETDYNSKKLLSSTNNEQDVDNILKKSKNISETIEEVNKCVCGISKLKSLGGTILSDSSEDKLGIGTGVVVSSNGYILSNCHVTGEKYSTCYITIDEKKTQTGKVVWCDRELDLSIIKIEANGLKYVKLGDSNNLKIGETVYAIGNPIGLEFRRTVTSGIISALNRTVKITENDDNSLMTDLIQTDATINPGNSGGPLIYPNGEVIGINSIKITSGEGLGFAVPINVVKPVIQSFIKKGNFKEANLGIYVYDESVSQYLTYKNEFSSGIYIAKIIKNGPAYNKDLQKGDIINSINDKKCNTVNDLREYIYSKNPGDSVNLKITRGKINKNISIKLGKK